MPYEENTVYTRIVALRKDIKSASDSNENGRIKAIILTKLQEAELFAKELYNKEA